MEILMKIMPIPAISKKILNIQNENIYMESEDRYDEFVNILIKDQTLPDVLVISDRGRQRTGGK